MRRFDHARFMVRHAIGGTSLTRGDVVDVSRLTRHEFRGLVDSGRIVKTSRRVRPT